MNNNLNILKKIATKSLKTEKSRKIPVYLKLEEDVVNWFKNEGKGYQERINSLLKDYVSEVVMATTTKVSNAQNLFEKYYSQCFWHLRRDIVIKEEHIPLIIEGLKKHGGQQGYLESQILCQ
jgi:hypothetical protein